MPDRDPRKPGLLSRVADNVRDAAEWFVFSEVSRDVATILLGVLPLVLLLYSVVVAIWSLTAGSRDA